MSQRDVDLDERGAAIRVSNRLARWQEIQLTIFEKYCLMKSTPDFWRKAGEEKR